MKVRKVEQKNYSTSRLSRVWFILILFSLFAVSACSSMVSSATDRLAGHLIRAMADHDDAETVATAIPAYLLLIDAMVRDNPNNSDLLVKASHLYSTYSGAFVQDPARSQKLTAKSLNFAMRAVCLNHSQDCSLRELTYTQFQNRLLRLTQQGVPTYYALGTSWAAWIQVRKDNMDAIAEISKVDFLMQRLRDLDEGHMQGGVHLYLGVLSMLLPPSLGGKAELASRHFDRAIELSGGRNLMIKVIYARHYARMLFDRPLHDRLLQEVLAADPHQAGYVLMNTMAQQLAKQLLETADEYF